MTDKWKARVISEGIEYAILTDEMHKGAFEKTVKEHKEIKELKKNHNLRGNMTSIEPILIMLGEISIKQITQERNAHGFKENKMAVQITRFYCVGDARIRSEKVLRKFVVTSENNLKKLAFSNEILQLLESFDGSIK